MDKSEANFQRGLLRLENKLLSEDDNIANIHLENLSSKTYHVKPNHHYKRSAPPDWGPRQSDGEFLLKWILGLFGR